MLKNRLSQLLLLTIVPVMFFSLSQFAKEIKGPFFLRNGDPDYAYLFNSVNILNFRSPMHIDHPGTTVQSFGAIASLFRYAFDPQNKSISHDMLERPEVYLTFFNAILNLINAAILFLVGISILSYTKNIFVALTTQSFPFLSITLVESLARYRPELMLITCGFMLVYALTIVLRTRKIDNKNLILLSMINGFGLATKLTYMPIIFLPLFIFRKFREFLFYFLIILGSFIFFTLPIITQYPRLIVWVYRLIVYPEKYGTGKPDFFVTVSTTFKRYVLIIYQLLNYKSDHLVYLSLLFAVIFLILVYLTFRLTGLKLTTKNIFYEKRILLGVFFIFVLQLFIISKHPGDCYELPMLTCWGIIIPILWHTFSGKIFILQKTQLKIFIAPCVVFFGAYLLLSIKFLPYYRINLQRVLNFNKDESLAVVSTLKNKYLDCAIIGYYGSSAVPFALELGYIHGGSRYQKMLKEIYEDSDRYYIYSVWGGKLWRVFSSKPRKMENFLSALSHGGLIHLYQATIIPFEEIMEKHPCVIFQGPSFDRGYYKKTSPSPPYETLSNYQFTDIWGGLNQTIYKVTKK
jgi:hypothetical protein